MTSGLHSALPTPLSLFRHHCLLVCPSIRTIRIERFSAPLVVSKVNVFVFLQSSWLSSELNSAQEVIPTLLVSFAGSGLFSQEERDGPLKFSPINQKKEVKTDMDLQVNDQMLGEKNKELTEGEEASGTSSQQDTGSVDEANTLDNSDLVKKLDERKALSSDEFGNQKMWSLPMVLLADVDPGNSSSDEAEAEACDRKRRAWPKAIWVGGGNYLLTNFAEICEDLKRPPDHVRAFFLRCLRTTGFICEIQGKKQLVFNRIISPTRMEDAFRSYILRYMFCHVCWSPDTIMEGETNPYTVSCNNCKTRRSVE